MRRRRIGSAIILVLAGAGIALSVYLTLLHIWKLLNPNFNSLCDVNQTFSCGAVSESKYARLFGLPLGLYGAGFYGALVVLALMNLSRAKKLVSLPSTILALSLLSAVVSVVLAGISFFLVEAFCLFCMLTWLVNFAVLGTTLWMMEAPIADSLARAAREFLHFYRSAGYYAAGFVFLGVIGIGGPQFNKYEAQAMDYASLRIVEGVASGKGPGAQFGSVRLPPLVPTPGLEKQTEDLTLAGHEPMAGPPDAPIQLVLFSDFECPYCQRAAFVLEALRQEYPDDVAVVYKHYPLDYDCNPYVHRRLHEHACAAAYASVCAKRQGRFWAMHDMMFKNRTRLEDDDLLSYAETIGLDTRAFTDCLEDRSVVIEVSRDIDEGKRLKIRGTPTLFINGHLWAGPVTSELLEKTIDRLLSD